MTAIKVKLMAKAACIRMKAGEDLESMLTGWPSLSDADKEQIRDAIASK